MGQPKTKMCRCGRGKIMTGRHSMFNGKNSKGKIVCAACIIDEIKAPFIKRD